MKKITLTLSAAVLLMASQFANAQTTTTTTTQTTTTVSQSKVEWKEKDEFHKVMAQTFHPVEDGNFAPIRARSAEMLEKAIAWQNSKAPADVDQQKVATTLRTMVSEIRNLNATIKNNTATDATIKTDLTKIHDTFHSIVGLCTPGDHHGHGHEGHGHDGHKH